MSESVPGSAEQGKLSLTWLGTAGFAFRAGEDVFLIDPYLSRNPWARPVQDLEPGDLQEGRSIFVSHGHFDHLLDIPQIAVNLWAQVYCHPTQACSLIRDGLCSELIVEVERDGQCFDFGSFSAKATYHDHIKFDLGLVLSTLLKINLRLPGLMPLTRNYPHGQVLSWRFEVGEQSIRHFGSAGMSAGELAALAQEKTDILLLPLQGHTRICEIGLEYVRVLKPRLVIPHHQDDFFPPISRMVDIKPFLKGLGKRFPNVEVIIPVINQSIKI